MVCCYYSQTYASNKDRAVVTTINLRICDIHTVCCCKSLQRVIKTDEIVELHKKEEKVNKDHY